ncbi:MAG: hypothetical protein AABZ14_04315, partial [Candidatus Margulisiibacteriota bacterium]
MTLEGNKKSLVSYRLESAREKL